ncbi:MAG: hypothetical protein ACK4FF_10605 [Limnobacter sp.]|uniref:hypothetical protein n=1 Tax=Limnobacter sp. TaxID=2003368 RepID=UPI003918AB36
MTPALHAGPGPALKFAVILVRTHASQTLLPTLKDLLNHSGSMGDLFVLHVPQAGPSDEESVVMARLGVRTHVREIELARITEAINIVSMAAPQDLLLFLRAGDTLGPAYMARMANAFDLYPKGAVFYAPAHENRDGTPTGNVVGQLAPQDVKPDWNLADPCAFTGLVVRKSHFQLMGGFHTGCQMVVHVDFWLRTHITMTHALVHLPGLSVQVQAHDMQWVVKFGARELLEWYTLNKRYSQWCGAGRLLAYIDEVKRIGELRPDLKAGLHEHLCDMSNRLLFMIAPAERHVLQPWLQNSVAVRSVRPEFAAIDRCLKLEFDPNPEELPNLYDGGYSIHSIGSFCHAAHMFRDRFRTFLDPRYFREVPESEKQDKFSNTCDHLYYRDHFGIRYVFNHHKPYEKKDAEFFRDAVHALQTDLDSRQPCILLHVAKQDEPAEDMQPLWDSMIPYAAPKSIMVVRFEVVDEARYLTEPVEVVRHTEPGIVEFHLPVLSQSNGVHFTDERDNRRLRRLVYSYTQIALSRMKLITA